MKGANAPTKGTPRFTVEFDLSIVRCGEPLRASVRAADGREWLVPVVSQDGAPAIPNLLGGDGQNPEPPPATALEAIYTELRRLWDSDRGIWPERRLAHQAAGFCDVRRPHKPGRQPESPEMLAARVHRLGDDHRSNADRDLLKRARREGVYSRGGLTEYGDGLLKVVEQAKSTIRTVLRSEPTISRAALRVRLGSGISEAAAEAAIFDLEADAEIALTFIACECGTQHLGLRAGRGPS